MTDEEKRLIKGQVVEELADVRGQLACLRSKSDTYKEQCKRAINVLTNNDPCDAPAEASWPSYDDLVAVWTGIQEATSRIKALEARLREWGAIS